MSNLLRAALIGVCACIPLAALAKTPHNYLSAKERAEGWILLFNGRTLNGWHAFKRKGADKTWRAADGTLTGAASGGRDLVTNGKFSNFALSLEWKIAPHGNSGIFYDVVELGPAAYFTGPEYQLVDNRDVSGEPREQTAGVYALYAPSRETASAVGQFNKTTLIVDHGHVEQWLNGVKVVEYQLGSPDFESRVAGSKFSTTGRYGQLMRNFAKARTGHIALQDEAGPIAFRDIKIRPLK